MKISAMTQRLKRLRHYWGGDISERRHIPPSYIGQLVCKSL